MNRLISNPLLLIEWETYKALTGYLSGSSSHLLQHKNHRPGCPASLFGAYTKWFGFFCFCLFLVFGFLFFVGLPGVCWGEASAARYARLPTEWFPSKICANHSTCRLRTVLEDEMSLLKESHREIFLTEPLTSLLALATPACHESIEAGREGPEVLPNFQSSNISTDFSLRGQQTQTNPSARFTNSACGLRSKLLITRHLSS